MTAIRTPKNRPHSKSRKGPRAAPRPRRLRRRVRTLPVGQDQVSHDQASHDQTAQDQVAHVPVAQDQVAGAQVVQAQVVQTQAQVVQPQVVQVQVAQAQVAQAQVSQAQVVQLQVAQLQVTPPEDTPEPVPHTPLPTIPISTPGLGSKRRAIDTTMKSMAFEAKRRSGVRRAPYLNVLNAISEMEPQPPQPSVTPPPVYHRLPFRPYARTKDVRADRRFKKKMEELRHRDFEGRKSRDGFLESPPPQTQPMVLDDSEDMIYATDPVTLQVVAAIPRTWGYRAMWQHLASIGRLDLAAHIGCPDSEVSKDVDIVMYESDNDVSAPVEETTVLETSLGRATESASSDPATTPEAGTSSKLEYMEWKASNNAPQVQASIPAVVPTPTVADAGSSSSEVQRAMVPSVKEPARREKARPRRSLGIQTTLAAKPTIQEPPIYTAPTAGPLPLSPPRTPGTKPMTEEEFQAALEEWATSSSTVPAPPQVPAPQASSAAMPFSFPVQETASAPPLGTQHPRGLPAVAATTTSTGSAAPSASSAAPAPIQYAEVPGRKVRRLPRSTRGLLDSSTATSAPLALASTSTTPSSAGPSALVAVPAPVPAPQAGALRVGSSGSDSSRHQSLAPNNTASGSGLSHPTTPSIGPFDRKGKGKAREPPAEVDTPQQGTTQAGPSGLGGSGRRPAAQTEGASGSGSSRPATAGGSAERSDKGEGKGKGKGKAEEPAYLKNLAEWGLDGDDEEEEEAQNNSHTFRAATRTVKGAGGLMRARR